MDYATGDTAITYAGAWSLRQGDLSRRWDATRVETNVAIAGDVYTWWYEEPAPPAETIKARNLRCRESAYLARTKAPRRRAEASPDLPAGVVASVPRRARRMAPRRTARALSWQTLRRMVGAETRG